MKRCPECLRDYHDDTLAFCLDDGSQLVDGPADVDQQTAVLHIHDLPTHASFRPAALTGIDAFRPTQPIAVQTKSWSMRGSWLPAAAAVLILAVGSFFAYRYFYHTRNIDSIAVMPFANESGVADLEYLSDGLTEALINSLSQVPTLNVKARSSVFRYKGKETSSRQIGSELGVQAVLNGSVILRGPDLILHVELIDASNENLLWSKN